MLISPNKGRSGFDSRFPLLGIVSSLTEYKRLVIDIEYLSFRLYKPSALGVVSVPRPNRGVVIARAHTQRAQQAVSLTKGANSSPVSWGGSVGEALGGKVCVNAVEAAFQKIGTVPSVQPQADKD